MVSKELVRQMRVQRGWSQAQLAEIMSVSVRTVQRIEKNGDCSLESKMALATAFSVSTEELEAPHEIVLKAAGRIHLGIFYLLAVGAVVALMVLQGFSVQVAVIWIVFLLTFSACSILSNGVRGSFAFVRLLLRYVLGMAVFTNPQRALVTLRRQIIYVYAASGFAFLLISTSALAGYFPAALERVMPVWFFNTAMFAVFFAEVILRPLKHRLESELLAAIEYTDEESEQWLK